MRFTTKSPRSGWRSRRRSLCASLWRCSFLTDPPTDTDAAGLVGFHREQVTYADVTDASGAQPSNVQLTAEETDAVYALLDALQYKRLGAASAMEDCYARLYFYQRRGRTLRDHAL